MATDLQLQPSIIRTALDHAVGVDPVHPKNGS